MKVEELSLAISQKKLDKQFYIFSGPEAFLKEQSLRQIVESLIPKEYRSENLFNHSCTAKNMTSLFELIFSFSFSDSLRVFAITAFEDLSAASKKDFLDKIGKFSLPEDAKMVFLVYDPATSELLRKSLGKNCEKIDFWTPFANKIPAWVKDEARKFNSNITNEAIEMLIELTGLDLATLHKELVKLTQLHKSITPDIIKHSVRYLKQDNVFDFLHYFGSKNLKGAIICIESLVNRGEEIAGIWHMLCRKIREMRLLHELKEDRPDIFNSVFSVLAQYRQYADKTDFKANQVKREQISRLQEIAEETEEELSKAIGLNQAVKLKSMYQALNFSLPQLRGAWSEMLETDLLLKSGVVDPKCTVQKFVARMLSA